MKPTRVVTLTALLAGSALLVLAPTMRARADALPPPEDCPSGQVWVNGHTGGCRDEAPTNCPPGWRGVVGGVCMVAVAGEAGECQGGAVAKPATICLEKHMDHGNGRLHYDPPRELQVPVGIVGPGAVCTGTDRHESAGRVCVGKDETPFPFVNGSDMRGPRRAEAAPGSGCARGCASGADAGALAVIGLALAWMARRGCRNRLQ